MNRYWFRPKRYGWGFTPISAEGWIATIVLVVLSLLSAKRNNIGNEPDLNLAGFILDMVIIITLSSLIFKSKTKGKLKFRWGR